MDLSQLIDVMASLEGKAIRVHPRLCTRLRHRRSNCSLCSSYCPSRAIRWGESLQVDREICTGCGLCAAVCPTAALEAESPSNLELLHQMRDKVKQGEAIFFVCSAPSFKDGGGGDSSLRVSCLGRLDESLLLWPVIWGAAEIVLLQGDCESCRYGIGRSLAEAVAQRGNALLGGCGLSQRVSIRSRSSLPSSLPSSAEPRTVSRRGLFDLLARRTGKTASTVLESVLPGGNRRTTPQEEIRSLRRDGLPTMLPSKRQLLLAALRRLPRPAKPLEIPDGPWTRLSLSKSCTGCQMCATFCPTGALTKSEDSGAPDLVFRASLCTNCRLCADLCYRRAVELSPDFDLGGLWGDVPSLLPMPGEAAGQPLLSTNDIASLVGSGDPFRPQGG